MTEAASSIWPPPRQEALLRLVLGADAEVASRWSALQPFVVDELPPGTFCMLPLLHTRLTDAGIVDSNSERIGGAYRAVWYRNQIARRRLGEILHALGEIGVDVVAFGGASASRFFEQAGHRPLVQIDLLVAAEHMAVAQGVIEASGDWAAKLSRHDYVRFEDAERVVVVAYSRLPPPLPMRLPDSVRGRLEETAVDATALRVFPASDELVIACGLGARVLVPPSVQWLMDAAAIVSAERLTPEDVVRSATDLHLVAATRDAVRFLADLTEDPHVGNVAAALENVRPSRRDTVAHRLGTRPDRASQRLSSYLRGRAPR